MGTYGEVRGRLSKLLPGVDLELLDGWIQDRYQQILDSLAWTRVRRVSTLTVNAEYATGTLDVVKGSTALAGAGTSWTNALNGRILRIAEGAEYYGFAYGSATTGTLDRTYQGDTVTGAAYKISQNVYAMPANARQIESVVLAGSGELGRKTWRELLGIDPDFQTYGIPRLWAPYMDSGGSPPILQVALLPVPVDLAGLIVSHIAEETVPGTTSAALLPWVRPGCLIAGVQADAAMQLKDYGGAQAFEAKFIALLANMRRIDAEQRGPASFRMDEHYLSHQSRRYIR